MLYRFDRKIRDAVDQESSYKIFRCITGNYAIVISATPNPIRRIKKDMLRIIAFCAATLWTVMGAAAGTERPSGTEPDGTVHVPAFDLPESSFLNPGSYDEIMSKFPPALLISGGVRDFALSEVAVTHEKLVRLGVQADLHVWEGMGHIFTNDPEYPESREAYDVIVRFFDQHLGR
jgi:acetyl esterase/lipase